MAPLLEGLPAASGDGVGLLHLLNGTSSSSSVLLAVGPSGTAVSELEAFPPAGAAKSVALTLRNGGVTWGRGQELWLCLGDGDVGGGGGGGDAPSEKEHQQQQQQRRGSARYDFQVLWSAPTVDDIVGSHNSSSGCISSSGGGGGSGGEGVVEETGSSGSAGADSVGEGEGQGEGQGEEREAEGAGRGRGAGPLGGHVVGELRPLNEFSAARQEALDEVRWLGLRLATPSSPNTRIAKNDATTPAF